MLAEPAPFAEAGRSWDRGSSQSRLRWTGGPPPRRCSLSIFVLWCRDRLRTAGRPNPQRRPRSKTRELARVWWSRSSAKGSRSPRRLWLIVVVVGHRTTAKKGGARRVRSRTHASCTQKHHAPWALSSQPHTHPLTLHRHPYRLPHPHDRPLSASLRVGGARRLRLGRGIDRSSAAAHCSTTPAAAATWIKQAAEELTTWEPWTSRRRSSTRRALVRTPLLLVVAVRGCVVAEWVGGFASSHQLGAGAGMMMR